MRGGEGILSVSLSLLMRGGGGNPECESESTDAWRGTEPLV